MITVVITERPGAVNACWTEEGTIIKLKAVPEGVIVKFRSEPESMKVELHLHPSMINMLAEFVKAQPSEVFMPEEGKAERLKELEEFNREWDKKQAQLKLDNPQPPF